MSLQTIPLLHTGCAGSDPAKGEPSTIAIAKAVLHTAECSTSKMRSEQHLRLSARADWRRRMGVKRAGERGRREKEKNQWKLLQNQGSRALEVRQSVVELRELGGHLK